MKKGILNACLAALASVLLILPAAAQVTAITGGTVHTMGAAGTLDGATVIIENGRITQAGTGVGVPDGARVIDATGKIVTPGLMESYSSFGLVEISLIAESKDDKLDEFELGAGFEAFYGINPNSTLIPIHRLGGVTRAITAPALGGDVFHGQAAAIHLGGGGNIVVDSSVAVFASVGVDGGEKTGGSRGAALSKLKRGLDEARYYVTHLQAYDRGQTRDYMYKRADLEALVPVVRGEKPLAVIANRVSDMRHLIAITGGTGVRLVIVGASDAWMMADELAAAKVPVIINGADNLPANFESMYPRLENAARLQAAGVTFAFGSDVNSVSGFGTHNSDLLTQMAGIAVAYGLDWNAALAALTVNPAKIWELDTYGTLEPGKEADVLVWSGDPLELSSRPEHVFIRGEEVPLVSRQTLLRDRYLRLGKERLPLAYH